MAERVKPLEFSRDFSINTIIGQGTDLAGDIAAAGFTRVDGSIRGNISARGRIIIGEKARMKSNVSGTFVTVGGVVLGDVLASEKLIVLSTGLVCGDIITRRIKADEGCLIHGRVVICPTEEKWQETVAEYRDRQQLKISSEQ
jgi:cytoskeletal protein CcmA (bactofilin family)